MIEKKRSFIHFIYVHFVIVEIIECLIESATKYNKPISIIHQTMIIIISINLFYTIT
jgi:hypothetical protein